MAGTLTLKECAERLGVHYMTAYRYIRLGRLPATKVAGEWRVLPSDLEALLADDAIPPERGQVDWSARLEDRLMAGDEHGAWTVVQTALASGFTPDGIHVDLLGPALQRIGAGWHSGDVAISEEHRATAVATKLTGRLGPRFVRRGRRRGRVIIGTPPGERHALPVSVVADLLRGAGWDVVELGADLPISEFVGAVEKAAPVVAVAISLSTRDLIPEAKSLVAAIREATVVPIVVGGCAVDQAAATELDADAWASDGRAAVTAVTAVATVTG